MKQTAAIDARRPGFALIAALWLVVAIASVGLEVALRARERRLVAANILEGARARAAAEAGLAHGRARLERALRAAEMRDRMRRPERRLDPWMRPGALLPDTVVLGDVAYRVALRDAGAMLHLNRATEEELRRFFGALRVDFGAADRLAQAILDWRDADDAHRARGAERTYYLRTGAPVLPRNGPFHELRELLYVKGMTPEIYDRARPYLTLRGTGQVNLNAALPPVLLALPGMRREAVAVLLRYRRQRRRLSSLEELSLALPVGARAGFVAAIPALAARTTLETAEVVARAEAWGPDGRARAEAEALFVRAGGAALPVWRRVE